MYFIVLLYLFMSVLLWSTVSIGRIIYGAERSSDDKLAEATTVTKLTTCGKTLFTVASQ